MLCIVAVALIGVSSVALLTLLTLVGWLYPLFGPSRDSRFRIRTRQAGRPAFISGCVLVASLFLFSLGDCFN